MVITVNGVVFDDSSAPLDEKLPIRFKWSDLGRYARIPEKKITNRMKISYTVPGTESTVQHVYGNSLILINGMVISVSA